MQIHHAYIALEWIQIHPPKLPAGYIPHGRPDLIGLYRRPVSAKYFKLPRDIPAEEIIAAVTMPLFWEANSIIFVVESIAHTFSRIDFYAKHYTLI